MTHSRASLLGLLALALASCAPTLRQHLAALQLAITVDDLPLHGPLPDGTTPLEVADEMIAALKAGGVGGVYGFVNGQWTERKPETADVLSHWRQAGFPLGNHGWSHRSVHDSTAADYEAEIARNEPLLDRLGRRSDWRWFRYPYLREGEDSAKRDAVRAILAQRGYRIASVTMDFSDWQWTAPYARCSNLGDAAAIARLETLYLASAREEVAYARNLSRQAFGRDIPYVLLSHAGAFTARMMPRLLALYRGEGFEFVSLPEAEADPAYAADLTAGPGGRSTRLERVAAALGSTVAQRTDYSATLAGFCRAPASG